MKRPLSDVAFNEAGILHIRVDARRIAVPEVYLGAGQWLTISGAKLEYLQCQRKWRTGSGLPGRRV